MTVTQALLTRFLRKIRFSREADGCWTWTAATGSGGYGNFWDGSSFFNAHRFAWLLSGRRIPAARELDHLCRNRACVRPSHLEAVTRAENLRRGKHKHRDKTRCVHGHAFTEGNTYVYVGASGRRMRVCRACRRARDKKRRAIA